METATSVISDVLLTNLTKISEVGQSFTINNILDNERVMAHLHIVLLLAIPDLFMRFVLKKPNTCRWYYLHAFANALVCYYTWWPALQVVLDPIHEIQNPIFFEESAVIVTVMHLYHLLFFDCKSEDWFHHLAFVGMATITQYSVNYGKLTALYHFFICGLPGGIDYLILGLVKDHLVSKETRLRIAVELNMWIRSPGICISWAFAIAWYVRSVRDWTHLFCFLAITYASVINAQHYARQVCLAGGKKLHMS